MSKDAIHIAIVGATGAVGQEILSVLERRNFPVGKLTLLASKRSVGKTTLFKGEECKIQLLEEGAFEGVDIAFFSAGATRSREFIPNALDAGAYVVDNSSAFRMQDDVPLVVPEVNPDDISDEKRLIANPNCCAAILSVVLWPIHQAFNIKRISVSTYQSASGAGAQAVEELQRQIREIAEGQEPTAEVFPFPLAMNLFSHNTAVAENGYNDEENKLVQEVQKMFHAPELEIIPTCIRVPVPRAHSEAVVIDTEKSISPKAVRDLLEVAPGVEVVDDVENGVFPMPKDASGKLDVLAGRIRQAGNDQSLALFISGDQLLKGAAWNAVQIGETLLDRIRLIVA